MQTRNKYGYSIICNVCGGRIISDVKQPKLYDADFYFDHRDNSTTSRHAYCNPRDMSRGS